MAKHNLPGVHFRRTSFCPTFSKHQGEMCQGVQMHVTDRECCNAFLISVINGAAGGLGFTLAIVLFASIRERVDKADCPECFKGYPLALIAAGFLALAFMGFSGLKIF